MGITAEQKQTVKDAVWKAPARQQDSPVEVLSKVQESLPSEQQGEAEYRTFYSCAAGLIISVDKGQRVVIDGEYHRVDEKIVEFQPQANHYGMYRTNDPALIKYLETRAQRIGDVLLPQDYNDRIMRPQDKIRLLQDENKRIIEEQNRLLAMLAAQQAGQK